MAFEGYSGINQGYQQQYPRNDRYARNNYQGFSYGYDPPPRERYQTQPQVNPYLESVKQTVPQPLPSNVLPGRVISDPKEIHPSEVPMGDKVCFFPLQDYSAIIAKAWDANGNIETHLYTLNDISPTDEKSVKSNEAYEEKFNDILERLARIEEALSTKRRAKKNDIQEETDNGNA